MPCIWLDLLLYTKFAWFVYNGRAVANCICKDLGSGAAQLPPHAALRGVRDWEGAASAAVTRATDAPGCLLCTLLFSSEGGAEKFG